VTLLLIFRESMRSSFFFGPPAELIAGNRTFCRRVAAADAIRGNNVIEPSYESHLPSELASSVFTRRPMAGRVCSAKNGLAMAVVPQMVLTMILSNRRREPCLLQGIAIAISSPVSRVLQRPSA